LTNGTAKYTTTTVRDYLDEPVPEETFTHLPLPWLSTISYQFTTSTTIHSHLAVQFTCLTVFLRNLSPSSLWSTSWSGTLHFMVHTFLHPIIVCNWNCQTHTHTWWR